MRQYISVLCLIAILTSSAWAQQVDTQPIAITNITVIDGTGSEPQPNMTLVIRNNIITDLFPSGKKRCLKNQQFLKCPNISFYRD